ncbi:helix-turn-helix domain-containing protein [Ensifer sp. PDNC004]|uniref:helix-turn-helix domain-containing protein n=1 Tax=Ensifer sp. PDNC004 TaxID=2811423 RepID=UPI001FED96C0|nr:helix-turn-helix domain-containing protein [Ensifer sp. PDNC004]
MENKISQAEIARTLRRDRSTICRELRRSFWHDREVRIAEGYWHVTAQQMAEDRRRRYRKLHHPRKCLGLQTPKEIFSQYLLAMRGQSM